MLFRSINAGIMLLSAENLRSGNVWRWFMRNAEVIRAMRLVGLAKIGSFPRPNLKRVAIRRAAVLSSRQSRLQSGQESSTSPIRYHGLVSRSSPDWRPANSFPESAWRSARQDHLDYGNEFRSEEHTSD